MAYGVFRRPPPLPPSSQSLSFLGFGVVGPISATAAITEANDTLSATATIAIRGSTSIAEAGDTLSATGALALKGTASITEANDSLSATATLAIKGTLSATEANDTLASAGNLPIVGALAVTEQNDTSISTGTIAIFGQVSIAEAGDTLAASALMPIFHPRRGGIDDRQEYERWLRDWQEDLRRIIDRSFLVAAGIIDPITFEPIPAPDYSLIEQILAEQAKALDQARVAQFVATEQQRQEEEAIAFLLLAA